MNLLFRNKQQEELPAEPQKKKPRGKPFTGKGDPRNNLSGRPKLGATLAARYRDALSEAESEARGGEYSKLDAMIDILIGKAMEGDLRAIEYLQERGFGKVPDRLELSREDMGEEITQYNWKLLTPDERAYVMYLLEKAAGQQPEELSEWVGSEKKRYRLVSTKEYIDQPQLPDVIEATVTEDTSSN